MVLLAADFYILYDRMDASEDDVSGAWRWFRLWWRGRKPPEEAVIDVPYSTAFERTEEGFKVHFGLGVLGYGIEVTKDEVIIEGKRLQRIHFGGFIVASNGKGGVARLGYNYGRKSFEFGALHFEHAPEIVASALNKELHAADERIGIIPPPAHPSERQF